MEHANSQLVKDIRDMWSHAGLEVESMSGNKVRCRMPPYFQGIQEFTQSLEPYDVVVDLETTMSAGTASVVFLVFAGSDSVDTGSSQQAPVVHQRPNGSRDIVLAVMVAVCMILQIVSMINFKEAGKLLKSIFASN